MIRAFRDEYFWMLRESKGYIPWLSKYGYKFARHVFGRRRRCPMCDECSDTPHALLKIIAEDNVYANELLDLVFKSIVRAEARFISRYIPQRSHEERLTGNLVSELDNAIFLAKDTFKETAIRLYSEPKEIDFFYYDLSRGGKLEKKTGADLALIIVIDLPDFPFTVKSIVLQAKKVNGSSAQIDRTQYEVLAQQKGKAAYLFYDMNLQTLCPPFVVDFGDYPLGRKYEECAKNNQGSFVVDFGDIMSAGHPLSLFLLSHLPSQKIGLDHSSFKSAFNYMQEMTALSSSARLAIVSIGGRIQFNTRNNESLQINIDHSSH